MLCGVYHNPQKHLPKDSWRWIGGDGPVFDPARRWLDGYFSGAVPSKPPPFHFSDGSEFQKKVWAELPSIQPGKTVSYGELAARIGLPKAVRAVGAAVGRNPISIIVPCHRVIGAGGKLTGYAGGVEKKKWLLDHEASLLRWCAIRSAIEPVRNLPNARSGDASRVRVTRVGNAASAMKIRKTSPP